MTLTTSLLDAPEHVFNRVDITPEAPHEQVVFCQDGETGLRAIIAIHSTRLGPALGGTRFYPFASESDALTDVLRLSRGMTYKAAIAGVDLGGGKAVIIGDPMQLKTPALLRAYGRFVERLGGLYITAGDVGTNSGDLDIIGQTTDHVVGRTTAAGGSGDSGPSTALGVFHSMRAAAHAVWGSPDLTGRRVGVEGLGKVGYQLVSLLVGAGAMVVVSDSYQPAIDRVTAQFPQVSVSPAVITEHLDIYSPCALGGTLTASTIANLSAAIVCGAANNQLLHPQLEEQLHKRGITWVPDYVANAGGLVQVEGELRGTPADEVRRRVERIYDTVLSIAEVARAKGLLLGAAADLLAEQRINGPTPA